MDPNQPTTPNPTPTEPNQTPPVPVESQAPEPAAVPSPTSDISGLGLGQPPTPAQPTNFSAPEPPALPTTEPFNPQSNPTVSSAGSDIATPPTESGNVPPPTAYNPSPSPGQVPNPLVNLQSKPKRKLTMPVIIIGLIIVIIVILAISLALTKKSNKSGTTNNTNSTTVNQPTQ